MARRRIARCGALVVPLVLASLSACGPDDSTGGGTTTTSLRSSTTASDDGSSTTATAPRATAPSTTEPPAPPPPKSATPAVFPPSEDPPRPLDATAPLTGWALGDSTAFTVGWGTHEALATSGLGGLTVDARTSTGLTRADFFDWAPQVFAIASTAPEVAVVSFGANDAQPIVAPDGTTIPFGGPGWVEEYERRVDGVLTMLGAAGTRVYWVGQPIARDPAYAERMVVLNGVYRSAVDRHPSATYVDAWHWFSDDSGAYTEALPGPDGAPVALRAADGIHLSAAGGDLLGGIVANRILADYGIAR